MKGFINFIREQGVGGLAVGFILGGAISKLVTSLVNDIINPLLGVFLGVVGNIKDAYFSLGSSKVYWGNFVNTLVDFLIVSFVVYFGFKILGLNNLNIKKKVKIKRK
ncbi:MAG: MscL family protein [Candidatus Shapirobacteria bacterium]|nr:MscL family protein [Candidatus Shapirobacteria bacterium]